MDVKKKYTKIFQKERLGATIAIDLFNQKTKLISKGHRNPQGLVVINNQDILITEHGPKGGDEINKIL
jgi:glucose/arabinose dehydrogenase